MNKFITCFTALVLACLTAHAQVIHDVQGNPYMEQSYTEVEGNPLLINSWVEGAIDFVNGKTVTSKVKYDLVKDALLFQNKSDTTALYFVEPVKAFKLNSPVGEESDILLPIFNSGYPAIDSQTPASFYQVIAGGKTQLLKHYRKVIRTDQAFNSATATKTFVLTDIYYLFANNQISRIKPNQKSILTALSDKTEQLKAYMKSNAVDYKSDVSLAKLFNYYNSL
ncbi:hypothetical protein [Mucilaginibacter lappiensis]|uniref:DUF4369 domain-containing protein n=1 Tax=Mucilaginibacter lappiensis TaxID=354630 RepID=A0A1N6ST14_9SPHI|nr:hypothetical protein [Mucilaginibacter lappiensis]MBB6108280.1 hypothetical protein [Mucilaginibacter lappiensis]MBB6129908.1 hypothetical protein [Mucilaginibacter lappiensis]SIQ44248.1 hypothetical protein SAMN05421821_102483 [Mucilaginibacter lappiensis]